MVMTLNLDYWETLSLNAGCNLYSSKFRLCVLTVRLAHEQQKQLLTQISNQTSIVSKETTASKESTSIMYFRERDMPLVPAEAFLATSVPKLLIGSLIIFLNVMAIITMLRSNRWISSRAKGYYVLPQSTQGLLHSLFFTYLFLGVLTVYSQVSLSTFLLGDYRLVEDQDKECLVVNSIMIGLSLSIALHLVSLAVDRTLASYLSYQKYATMSRGTVPLWLLSIWLPSGIMGSLPLSGWKTSFRFCIFLYQFNDDYLRFIGGFWFSCILAIPFLYLFFLTFLKSKKEEQILYRWHRKLQAHHRLTFILVLVVNILCWSPFHAYLLLACQSCLYSSLSSSGDMLEHLFILALLPSLIIPLMFSIRSTFVDKCVQRISQCVTFGGESSYGTYPDHGFETKNPLSHHTTSSKSPLFFIDDIVYSTSASSSASRKSGDKDKMMRRTLQNNSADIDSRRSSYNSNANGGLGTVRTSSFFVPHYLPNPKSNAATKPPQNQSTLETKSVNCNNFKSSFKNKYESYYSTISSPQPPNRNTNRGKLRNFCAYLNTGATGDNNEVEHVYDSLDSDSKYGFPIIPIPNVHQVKNTKNRAR